MESRLSRRPPVPIRFDLSWLSAAVLQLPLASEDGIEKGALILNYVDEIMAQFPALRRKFFVIERRGWRGPNRSAEAEIKLVEDIATLPETRARFPNALLLPFGPADFVDHDAFRPVACVPDFDVIQISCWSPRKRVELLIQAAARLPELSFVHLGHFEHGGTEAERAYRAHCLRIARRSAPNVNFPYLDSDSNRGLPKDKAEINQWINRARIGVLTAAPEGINRFKMECLSAGRPILVAADAGSVTQKHVNPLTGRLFSPTPERLAAEILAVRFALEQFSPRAYVLANTGKDVAIAALKEALRQLCERGGGRYHFDRIVWDGRNESLVWGQAAHAELGRLCGAGVPSGFAQC